MTYIMKHNDVAARRYRKWLNKREQEKMNAEFIRLTDELAQDC